MPWLLEQLDASGPAPRIVTDFVGGSGMTLRQQWKNRKTLAAIRSGRWDYVVLQGQSIEPRTARESFLHHARLLDREIRGHGAKTVLFLTWAPKGQKQSAISDPYQALGRELAAIVAPVGIAWQRLLEQGVGLYDGSGVHPSLEGSYLSACVFYATLKKRSPVGLRYRFHPRFDIPEAHCVDLESDRLTGAQAREIQRAAWESVTAGETGGGRGIRPSR